MQDASMRVKARSNNGWNLTSYILAKKDVTYEEIARKADECDVNYGHVIGILREQDVIMRTLTGYSVKGWWRD